MTYNKLLREEFQSLKNVFSEKHKIFLCVTFGMFECRSCLYTREIFVLIRFTLAEMACMLNF